MQTAAADARSSTALGRFAASKLELDLSGLRSAGAVMLALGVLMPAVGLHGGPPCPLRTITGVPCPFCGMTTSVLALLHGHPAASLAASPGGIVAVIVAGYLIARPRLTTVQIAVPPIVVGLALSWLFQLRRFGYI